MTIAQGQPLFFLQSKHQVKGKQITCDLWNQENSNNNIFPFHYN